MPQSATQLTFPNVIHLPVKPTLTSNLHTVSPSNLFAQADNMTSQGKPKAQKADPLRSYTDYARIHAYFASRGRTRDAALLSIGIATGLRISDLVSLRIGHLVDTNGNFLPYITLNEKKTGKSTKGIDDSVLITEAIQNSATLLINELVKTNKETNLESFLFSSKQPRRNKTIVIEDDDGNVIDVIEDPLYGQKVITPDYGRRIMQEAAKALSLPIHVGSHTLRKTFMCLAYMFALKGNGTNPNALETVQILARHDDPRTTMSYLEITSAQTSRIRHQISDFLLGRSEYEDISIC